MRTDLDNEGAERPEEKSKNGLATASSSDGTATRVKWPWLRYRFHANPDDWRPVTFPPPGPYWCSGMAGDDSYAIIVAYLPVGIRLLDYWPEASSVERNRHTRIIYSDRFPQPEWWTQA